jgi:hypothetical protein
MKDLKQQYSVQVGCILKLKYLFGVFYNKLGVQKFGWKTGRGETLQRQRQGGKDIKMDRVHSDFIWSRAESSDGSNLLIQSKFNQDRTCLNDFTVVGIG